MPLQDAESAAPKRPLIIDRPDLQTLAQRFGYLSVTFVFWSLWLYLFLPLLSFAAWALGATVVYRVMLMNLKVDELLDLLRVYGVGILALTAAYLLWAVSSWLRFRHVHRRGASPEAGMAELAASHRLSVTELATLRDVRRTVLPSELLGRMFGGAALPEEASPAEPAPRRAAGGR